MLHNTICVLILSKLKLWNLHKVKIFVFHKGWKKRYSFKSENGIPILRCKWAPCDYFVSGTLWGDDLLEGFTRSAFSKQQKIAVRLLRDLQILYHHFNPHFTFSRTRQICVSFLLLPRLLTMGQLLLPSRAKLYFAF